MVKGNSATKPSGSRVMPLPISNLNSQEFTTEKNEDNIECTEVLQVVLPTLSLVNTGEAALPLSSPTDNDNVPLLPNPTLMGSTTAITQGEEAIRNRHTSASIEENQSDEASFSIKLNPSTTTDLSTTIFIKAFCSITDNSNDGPSKKKKINVGGINVTNPFAKEVVQDKSEVDGDDKTDLSENASTRNSNSGKERIQSENSNERPSKKKKKSNTIPFSSAKNSNSEKERIQAVKQDIKLTTCVGQARAIIHTPPPNLLHSLLINPSSELNVRYNKEVIGKHNHSINASIQIPASTIIHGSLHADSFILLKYELSNINNQVLEYMQLFNIIRENIAPTAQSISSPVPTVAIENLSAAANPSSSSSPSSSPPNSAFNEKVTTTPPLSPSSLTVPASSVAIDNEIKPKSPPSPSPPPPHPSITISYETITSDSPEYPTSLIFRRPTLPPNMSIIQSNQQIKRRVSIN